MKLWFEWLTYRWEALWHLQMMIVKNIVYCCKVQYIKCIYRSDPLPLILFTQNRQVSSRMMYNVQLQTYNVQCTYIPTTDTFIINYNMQLCVNIYIQYMHVPKQPKCQIEKNFTNIWGNAHKKEFTTNVQKMDGK